MINLFVPSKKNQHHRDVHVTSSRYGTEIVKVWADEPVDAVEALRVVQNSLRQKEPGETLQVKTFF